MLNYNKFYYLIIIFLLVNINNNKSLGQEENRDTKQHPELTKLVKHWAQKLGGELWHFGELVTRRSMVIESFKSTTVIKEDGETLLKDIHERISNMMKQKVEAVKRIMDIAEEAAKAQKEDDIDFNFQFYNSKNLTNSAPNSTVNDQEIHEPEIQELRYDDSFISTTDEERYQAMVQPEEEEIDGYQQDQNQETTIEQQQQSPILKNDDNFDEKNNGFEISDGTEKDPQASQIPNNDKSRLALYPNRHFYNIPVNTNYSAVHVPSNVYERSKEVIAGIIWSEELDKTFRNNYKLDPTLSWQYFGSSTGFMRQFPAMIWSEEPIDLFDCRTRSWYIEAASSPKDIIILVDRSGSMTGMRREIARHVVHNILDTLGNNDYVNIFTFSNTTDPLVECFDNMLVQANLANVRLLKETMNDFKTEQIANFSLALITAFELLEEYRELRKGANCNQAIMLITDGVQYNYKEIFEKYNWQNLPFVNVRVFTYLIGREVSDVREVKWMACANRGYYVHLSTYAEVREEVLHYIPVMARPMVLNSNQKPNPTWSPVYADVTDPKLTNWLWVNRQRNRQRERFLAYRRNKTLLPPDEQDKKFVHQQKYKQDNYGELQTYRLMTSVSLPVYDKRPRANITEKIQINEAIWINVTREERVANLLGVAGTDVPIEYIQRLMLAYRLGVNGYGFIITNNGYILVHPDLRPVYQGILKPAYNRVDITEVEIIDDDSEPRQFNDDIKELRKRVVMQKKGNATLKVKTHLDDMRRVITSVRHYFYMGINNTPFSLVIALPHKYGFYRIQHPVENDIHRIRSNDKIKGSLTQFFTGNWTIHPDWHYCRYLDDRHYFETPEEEFIHFLRKMEGPGWKWSGECDRKLICKVVADAKITSWFSQNITTTTKEENGPIAMLMALIPRAEFIRRMGITVAFLATHSGLTRWQDFPQNIDPNLKDEPHFHILHNKAIDETWYKRAVEHYFIDPMTFVYSVPFDIGDENNLLLTVSHAIFREDSGKKAPAAVIGYQFYHSALYALFKQITTSRFLIAKLITQCKRTIHESVVFLQTMFTVVIATRSSRFRSMCGDITCKRTCESSELHCLLLDDNGYIIVSDNLVETGYFFGRIRPDIMQQLVDDGIYRVTRMYDYQGLCPEEDDTNSPANSLYTYWRFFENFKWILQRFLLIISTLSQFLTTLSLSTEEMYKLYHKAIEEHLKYAPCDEETYNYLLNSTYDSNKTRGVIYSNIIPNTNLLLLVFDDFDDNYYINDSLYDELKLPEFNKIKYQTRLECEISRIRTGFIKKYYTTCYNQVEINPIRHLIRIYEWFMAISLTLIQHVISSDFETVIYTSDINTNNDNHHHHHHHLDEHDDYVDHEHDDDDNNDNNDDGLEVDDQPISKFNDKEFDQRLLIKKTIPEPCDNEMWLYNLIYYTDRNITNSGYNKTMQDCNRPFIVQRVSGSNMILLVINNLCREDNENIARLPDPQQIHYENMSLACYRAIYNDFPRRHYMSCINRSANESEIKLCGDSCYHHLSKMLTILIILIDLIMF